MLCIYKILDCFAISCVANQIFSYILLLLFWNLIKYNSVEYSFKYEYLKEFIDWTYHEKYDNKRELMQEKIIDKYFDDKPVFKNESKWLIFTGGCYGAGKSHIMRHLHKLGKINLDNYVYADQDKMRDFLPEYQDYLKENHFTAGFKTNKETSYMSEMVQKHALFSNYNLIIDSSLRDGDWHLEYISWIKQKFPDYKIAIVFVDASWERILERNIKRGEITKRVIPLKCLEDAFEQSPKSFEMLKSHVDLHYYVTNNIKHSFDSEECPNEIYEQIKNISFI